MGIFSCLLNIESKVKKILQFKEDLMEVRHEAGNTPWRKADRGSPDQGYLLRVIMEDKYGQRAATVRKEPQMTTES